MYKKNNARTTYKSARRPSYKKSGFQNYKARNKGNVSQQYNKYLKLAKESFRSGDRIQSEYYYQFTDHYYRLMIELGMNVEENLSTEDHKDNNPDNNQIEENGVAQIDLQETKPDEESIESIPFIADAAKEKRTRSSK